MGLHGGASLQEQYLGFPEGAVSGTQKPPPLRGGSSDRLPPACEVRGRLCRRPPPTITADGWAARIYSANGGSLPKLPQIVSVALVAERLAEARAYAPRT